MSAIKKFIKGQIVEPTSMAAVDKIINSDKRLYEVWQLSRKLIPDFSDHFTTAVESREVERRIRLLIVAETDFIRSEIEEFTNKGNRCSYADVGDSDGSVQLLLQSYFRSDILTTTGINLQKSAVEKIRRKGLNAVCADALTLHKQEGITYDLLSVFETLEHLPDPIGFLRGIRATVEGKLIVSVPFIRCSRVGMGYLSEKWPHEKTPTIENTHIFELSPKDWTKIFMHTGWKIEREKKLMMYPASGISRLLLQPYWRYVSFEGFWFVSLQKNDEYSSRFVIE